jgi:hypothetical protein
LLSFVFPMIIGLSSLINSFNYQRTGDIDDRQLKHVEMLKIFKKENSSTYVFTKSMGMSIERSIIYYERQLLL